MIPVINLLQELKTRGFPIDTSKPRVRCKLFKDNSGAIEMAKVPKMRPRTKHINIRYHHFRSFVKDKIISILKIDTADQPTDMMTKPVPLSVLIKHRKKIMGW